MRNGYYRLEFGGAAGLGAGLLIFDRGAVAGTDSGGVEYSGTYTYVPDRSAFAVNLSVTPSVSGMLVTGAMAQGGAGFTLVFDLPVNFDGKVLPIRTPTGTVNAKIRFLRDLPATAA